LHEHLPIYVINLKKRTDRKEQIENQLHNLGITNFKMIEAIDGTDDKEIEKMNQSYDPYKAKLSHREMTRAEIATSLSHLEICKKIVQEKIKYALILEDDALLTLDFKYLIKDFDVNENYIFDILMLGSISNNYLNNDKVKTHACFTTLVEHNSVIYLEEPEYKIGDLNICSPAYPSWYLNPILTTHAYIVSYEGAQKIIDVNNKIFVPIDLT
jgi:glycosyl transferase family 25